MSLSTTSDPLARVKRAARRRERSEDEFRALLRAEHEAGVSYADLARALGVSRQAVRQLLTR